MENGAFTADSETAGAAESPPPLEMKTQRTSEEKQPLCQCDRHCSCLEEGGQPADRKPDVQMKTWGRPKTVALAIGMAALLVWCGVMAAMHHYGIL
ncbi:hypothetical protein FJT64_013162 [Amphibalanus amphitrite]|uniref:Uncharacterized protein n=1 Tax=Amphibalanus amphitrite TaxID=1232801 RepID=A0A6A4UXG6_AMPAM|nr:hypothetical protein FJT64_013162 [Amphibalanus amphitrite]